MGAWGIQGLPLWPASQQIESAPIAGKSRNQAMSPILGTHHIHWGISERKHICRGQGGWGECSSPPKNLTILTVTKRQPFTQACTCEFDCWQAETAMLVAVNLQLLQLNFFLKTVLNVWREINHFYRANLSLFQMGWSLKHCCKYL